MERVSTNQSNYDMRSAAAIREKRMNDMQNKITEGSRINELRDDPVAAAHSTRFKSRIFRLERYEKNVTTVQDQMRIAETYMNQTNHILQRVRELAVQGATGTFTTEEKKLMGHEVNQLLNEVIEIANASDGTGRTIFAGDKNQGQAFRVFSGSVQGSEGTVVTGVQYLGGNTRNMVEVSEGSYVENSFIGNEVFWAEHQEIFSTVPADGYVVQENTSILIDGVEIGLKAGDTVHDIMARIKDSDVTVSPYLDPVSNSLVLKTTVPHQITMEDAAGSTVLRDLGLVSGNGMPPHNIHKDAVVAGGSLFDMMIHLRDNLYAGDTIDIGGASLKGLDLASSNLLGRMAKLGSQDERLETVKARLNSEIPLTRQQDSSEVDLDLAEAIMELKMLEYNHKAALQTAGRILQPTLLDFLR
ncbi:MAG: flagellar hook-associated protein 3 [Spirochaetales bacterium]|nr:flagellar hook-associated protein 3 [Spirochaetales bacterium]